MQGRSCGAKSQAPPLATWSHGLRGEMRFGDTRDTTVQFSNGWVSIVCLWAMVTIQFALYKTTLTRSGNIVL